MTQIEWIHDPEHVRLLHHAHADHIESAYRGMLQLPDNPAGVVIRPIGSVRTFIAKGQRLENRAIFTGQETAEQIDTVLRHFDDRDANCVIEVNPANYCGEPPRRGPLLEGLLARGCRVAAFRCVWCREAQPGDHEEPLRHRWECFEPEQFEAYVACARQAEPTRSWCATERAAEFQPGWLHYVGFDGDRPAAVCTLFAGQRAAYLAWGFTAAAHRGRGLHQDAVRLRVREALRTGCGLVFTVTDFSVGSSRNLQRCGFRLAYNYLLVWRDATHTVSSQAGREP